MNPLSSAAIRRTLIADPGYSIISADYDQIELRVAAGYAQEQTLIDAAYRGESLHKTAAVKLFGQNYNPDQYRYTKNVNFGWLFGGGAKTLATQAGIPLNEAAKIIDQYSHEFKALTAYKKQSETEVIKSALGSSYGQYLALKARIRAYKWGTREHKEIQRAINSMLYGRIGYVHTDFGRRLVVEAHKAYPATNYKVQSTSRDILAQVGLRRIMEDIYLQSTVLLVVHDEILGLAREDEAEEIVQQYAELMTTEFKGVPITASGKVYGPSWGHGYI